eukprot:IDg11564t1
MLVSDEDTFSSTSLSLRNRRLKLCLRSRSHPERIWDYTSGKPHPCAPVLQELDLVALSGGAHPLNLVTPYFRAHLLKFWCLCTLNLVRLGSLYVKIPSDPRLVRLEAAIANAESIGCPSYNERSDLRNEASWALSDSAEFNLRVGHQFAISPKGELPTTLNVDHRSCDN